MSVTYPIRLKEWHRPGDFEHTRLCPVCNGHGWVSEPVRVFYRGEERREAAVTVDCMFCDGTGRVRKDRA